MKRSLLVFGFVLFVCGLLSAQTITVTMPYSGMTWWTKLTMDIRWTTTGSLPGQVRIQLRNAASTSVVKEIVNPTPNNGNYMWTIPASMTPGQYRVRVKAIGVDVYGDSQVFAIDYHPEWNLTAPPADAKWAKGAAHQITWTNFGPVPAKLNINLVQGQTKTLIATCVPDTGSYSWTIAMSIPAGQYQIELDGKTASCQSAGFLCSGPIFNITLPLFPSIKAEKKK